MKITKSQFADRLTGHLPRTARAEKAINFAPSNIALIKYWGKRDEELILPVTNSLSVSLGNYGSTTTICHCPDSDFSVSLNSQTVPHHHPLSIGIINYLNILRIPTRHLQIEIQMNIPFAAGLASSACGFAALIKSINQLFGWQLDNTTLSMLARIGSGSACRSLWNGFVEWHKGCNADGSDSFASPLKKVWPDLCLGILITSEQCKPISSREAMRKTVNKSMRYRAWPEIVSNHLEQIKLAIESEDFSKLGRTCEKNAVAMHQTMLDINPSIIYGNEQTVAAIESVHMARRRGIECFYTQDAGPNLKIIHQKKDNPLLRELFPRMITINPFSD